MAFFVARIYRMVPLIVGLILLAVAVFAFYATFHDVRRAKQALLTLFRWVGIAGTVAFLLATLYAAFDGSSLGVELFAWSAGIFAVALGIEELCRLVQRRNRPSFKVTITDVTDVTDDGAARTTRDQGYLPPDDERR